MNHAAQSSEFTSCEGVSCITPLVHHQNCMVLFQDLGCIISHKYVERKAVCTAHCGAQEPPNTSLVSNLSLTCLSAGRALSFCQLGWRCFLLMLLQIRCKWTGKWQICLAFPCLENEEENVKRKT